MKCDLHPGPCVAGCTITNYGPCKRAVDFADRIRKVAWPTPNTESLRPLGDGSPTPRREP